MITDMTHLNLIGTTCTVGALILTLISLVTEGLNNCKVALGSQTFGELCLAFFVNSTVTTCIEMPDELKDWITGISVDPITLDVYMLIGPNQDNRYLYKIPLIELLDFEINNLDSLNDVTNFRNTINWDTIELVGGFTSSIHPSNLVNVGCIKNSELFDQEPPKSQLFVIAGNRLDSNRNHIYRVITDEKRLELFGSYNVEDTIFFGRPFTYSPWDKKFYIFRENNTVTDSVSFDITQIDPITGIDIVTNTIQNNNRVWMSIAAIDNKTLVGYHNFYDTWYLLNIYSSDNEIEPYIGTSFTHDILGKGLECFDGLIKKRESCPCMFLATFFI